MSVKRLSRPSKCGVQRTHYATRLSWSESHGLDQPSRVAVSESIEELARRRVSTIRSYATCFRDISFDHTDGVLTMRGRLPSFYAKQVLQTLLRDLDGVERIDNQTDVVSATGLSSVRRY